MTSHDQISISEQIDRAYQARTTPGIILRLLDRGPIFYILLLSLYAAKAAGLWLVPLFASKMVDSLAYPGKVPPSSLIWLGAITAVAIVVNIPLHSAFVEILSRAVRSLEQRLRLAGARRLQQLSISFHQNSESGRLQTKLLRDVEQVQLMLSEFGNTGSNAIIMFAVSVGYSLFAEPRMLLFFFVAVPITIAVVRSFRMAIKTRNSDYREQVEIMNSGVVEMVDMLPLARAHGIEDVAVENLAERFTRVNENGRLLDRINAVFQASAWVTFQLFSVAVLCMGFWFVTKGWMSLGQLVLFQTLFGYIVGSVQNLLNLFPTYTRGTESLRSLGEILQSPDLEHNAGKAHPTEVAGRITFDNVGFTYPGTAREAISQLDLEIATGSTVAFVGASGSGKSTLVNLLIGFLRPTHGRILLDGTDMETIDMRVWRRRLAVVPQQITLFGGSIRDNILFGLPNISEEWLQQVLELTHIRSFTDDLPDGIHTRVGERGTMLSGGQRQRIAIARALIRDPRVIVLDEPTSALDVSSERHVQEALEALTRNRTTIIVAHRLSTIRNADTICVLEAGRLIESGTFTDLIAAGGAFATLHAHSALASDVHE